MRDENGYVLLIVLVLVCVVTFGIISLMSQTTQASFLAAKRVGTIQAFPLAESAAMEGYWSLVADPAFRTTDPLARHWGNSWYRFSIIDDTPLDTDDLNLEVLGEGFTGSQQRRVILQLTRLALNSSFTIRSWKEDN